MSHQNLVDNVAAHVGEADVAALVFKSEPGVVDSEAMQNRRLQVVDVDRILRDVVGVIVGVAMDDSRLDATASHPHGKAAWMVVSPVIVFGQPSLAVNG